jgi:hypothetical protein
MGATRAQRLAGPAALAAGASLFLLTAWMEPLAVRRNPSSAGLLCGM